MKITLSPIASDHTTEILVEGLALTIDGTTVDLSVIPEGGYAEPEDTSPFIGKVTRDDVTVLYHYDSVRAEHNQSIESADYIFDITSGIVPCPIVWKPEQTVVEDTIIEVPNV